MAHFQPSTGEGADTSLYIFNVRDYFAVGNGLTDDTEAFNAAQAAASAAGGGTIYAPRGTYIIDTYALATNTVLQGAGKGVTVLKAKDASSDHTVRLPNVTDATLRDLTIDGNKSNQSSARHGIAYSGLCERIRIYNVEVKNAKRSGFYVLEGNDCQYTNIESYDCDYEGFQIGGNNNSIDQITVKRTGSANISIDDVDGLTISNALCETSGLIPEVVADNITGYSENNKKITITNAILRDSANHGTHLGGEDITLDNIVIDTPVRSGVFIKNNTDTRASNLNMSNVTITNAGDEGVELEKVDGCHLSNVNATGCGANGINASICTDVTIVSGELSGNTGRGVRLYETRGYSVIGVEIFDNDGGGIILNGLTDGSNDGDVELCRIYDNGNISINHSLGGNSRFFANTIYGNLTDAITFGGTDRGFGNMIGVSRTYAGLHQTANGLEAYFSTTKVLEARSDKLSLGGGRNAEALVAYINTSNVNRINIRGAITGDYPEIGVEGTDSNIPLGIRLNGTGILTVREGLLEHFRLTPTANAANYHHFVTATAGNPAIWRISSATETNAGAKVEPKGNGKFEIPLANVPTYADDAAAGAGGLTAGQFYKTSVGALMIKL